MNIRVLRTSVGTVTLVVLFAGSASATLVPLVNPSFEVDSVGDGQQISYPTGWSTVIGVGAGDVLVGRNPTSAEFPGAGGNGALPSPAQGSQALFNASTMDNECSILGDSLQPAITLQAHTTYTLTVAFGQGLNNTSNALGYYTGFGLIVLDAGPSFAGTLVTTEFLGTDDPAPGTFKDFSVTFDSDTFLTGQKGSPKAGDQLRIGFDLGTGIYADNVRLDIAPEPSTLVLLASGLVGLLAYARRRRR